MGIKQYRVGKKWEEKVMGYYADRGYSTFKMATEIEGTVFDIIALKNNKAVCIECKHIKGDKLYYKSSGLEHKRDELDNFYRNGNGVIIYVNSDKDGIFMIDWLAAKSIFINKGYVDKNDCVSIYWE